ncbi:MAG: dipeptidase [Spirochaetaceae bacterium]|nr:MAG: dipeptidase [Spirochaetaceae bacterium]
MEQRRQKALEFLRNNHENLLLKLEEFIRIPSISTEPQHHSDVRKAAEWLADHLKALDMEAVEIFPTQGAPLVFGASRSGDSDAPTLLIYGHYDVQPVDPLEEWEGDPFEPRRQSNLLYARGASDMKGQIMAALNALQAVQSAEGSPIRCKFLFEGEEEVGSPNLYPFIQTHRELLACDLCLNPDTGMLGPELPTITYGLRGLAYFELRLRGPSQDLHSGSFGGVVHNPAQVLCELIADLHDQDGRVTIPGFYDPVLDLSPEERQELARLPVDEAFYQKNAGVKKLWGEPEFTPLERVSARPTLEVNGLLSGFIGEGSKTVLPAAAMAKISCRLVADQKPEEVKQQLERYLRKHLPETVSWELKSLASAPPVLSPRDSRGVRALSTALEAIWGKRPLFRREGGTVPIGAYLQELLGIESVQTGFALPDDNAHSPNEKLNLQTWSRGIEALVHFIYNLSEGGS